MSLTSVLRPVVSSLLALLTMTLFLVGISRASAASSPSPDQAVTMLNQWRASVGVGAVVNDPVQSEGCRLHTNYFRLNNTTGHFETPGLPGYTDAGHMAARSSVLHYGSAGSAGPLAWEDAPYHRTGLLYPRLSSTGFWNEFGMGCMGVFGRSDDLVLPQLTAYPYPRDGQTAVQTTFGCNETPNPCEVVPGNGGRIPTGFISTVQFNGPWPYGNEAPPVVTAASLTPDGAAAVAITVEDRDTGRPQNLDGGLSVIPHRPLTAGSWYTAHVAGYVEHSLDHFSGAVATLPFDVSWRFRTVLPAPAQPRLKKRWVRGRVYTVSWPTLRGAVSHRVRVSTNTRVRIRGKVVYKRTTRTFVTAKNVVRITLPKLGVAYVEVSGINGERKEGTAASLALGPR